MLPVFTVNFWAGADEGEPPEWFKMREKVHAYCVANNIYSSDERDA